MTHGELGESYPGSFDVEALAPVELGESSVELSPEDRAVIDHFLGDFDRFVGGGWEAGLIHSLQQLNGYGETEEAMRDEVVARLEDRFQFEDLEQMLTTSELEWRESGQGILLEPWMKRCLGIDDPDRPLRYVGEGGARRRALLQSQGGREFWLEEIEIPNIGPDGAERVNRLMFYSSQPLGQ